MIIFNQHSFMLTHEGFNTQKEFDFIIKLIQKTNCTYRLINAEMHLRNLYTPKNYMETIRKDTTHAYIADQATGEILAYTGQTIRILVYKNK